MAKTRPSRPRPLTLRSLTAPARAHKKRTAEAVPFLLQIISVQSHAREFAHRCQEIG
ncbi:hypothetical protein GKD02_02895 [Lactobacillus rhamnosus]|nr:hypothetical protein [Lacticaseibacillus rhamnosus]